jgi:hypothetical protein
MNITHPLVQGDQKVSVHLIITILMSDAQILFDHPVLFTYDIQKMITF